MAMVIVILLNVLIAQLSFTYSEAKNNAKLQYAIDRMSIVTRLEQSRFGVVSIHISMFFGNSFVGFKPGFHMVVKIESRSFSMSNFNSLYL
jgi:competence transcription factor ComK